MDILLSANLKLLDKVDEDGVWTTIISFFDNIIQIRKFPRGLLQR